MKDNSILEKIEAGIKEGNAGIAKEVSDNVEKFGISPVIAINGKIKNLKPNDLSDKKELHQLIKKYGYDEKDFCVLEDSKAKYNAKKTTLISGSVVCICNKSGKVKEYSAANDSSWLESFGTDLKNKFFSN